MFTQNAVFYARIWIDVFVDKKNSILDIRDIIVIRVNEFVSRYKRTSISQGDSLVNVSLY